MINAEDAEKQRSRLNQITSEIISASIRIHTDLGPGLLENAYQVFLHNELELRGFQVKSQVYLPVEYRGKKVNLAYRMDMVVNDCVVVELKAIQVIDARESASPLVPETQRNEGRAVNQLPFLPPHRRSLPYRESVLKHFNRPR